MLRRVWAVIQNAIGNEERKAQKPIRVERRSSGSKMRKADSLLDTAILDLTEVVQRRKK